MFHRDTVLITKDGNKPFRDFRLGDLVQVMDKDGIWRDATITSSATGQTMIKVTLQKGDDIKEIICTENHHWLLDTEFKTRHIGIGNHLYPFAHQADWRMSTTSKKLHMGNTYWTVTDIEVLPPENTVDGVGLSPMCVNEPITHSFCLEGNIVTLDY